VIPSSKPNIEDKDEHADNGAHLRTITLVTQSSRGFALDLSPARSTVCGVRQNLMFARIKNQISRMAVFFLVWIFFHPKWPSCAAASGEGIIAHLKRAYTLMIGQCSAKNTQDFGSVLQSEHKLTMEAKRPASNAGLEKQLPCPSLRTEPLLEPYWQTLESVRITPPAGSTNATLCGLNHEIFRAKRRANGCTARRFPAPRRHLSTASADISSRRFHRASGRVSTELQFLPRAASIAI
jgi:hypothetical protein